MFSPKLEPCCIWRDSADKLPHQEIDGDIALTKMPIYGNLSLTTSECRRRMTAGELSLVPIGQRILCFQVEHIQTPPARVSKDRYHFS